MREPTNDVEVEGDVKVTMADGGGHPQPSRSLEAALAGLDARVAVVAGASRGIGKGVSLELGAAGTTVYLTGRTVQPSEGASGSLVETADEIAAAGGVGVPVRCDHASDEDVAALFARIPRRARTR